MADYLVGEVLVRLSDDEREVLRCTCICDPVLARLAVELSGREDAAELLDRLEHDTGLVTGSGPQRAFYRVPQLMRSYLVADLQRSGPDRVAELHRRAAVWYSGEGCGPAALIHATRAGDSGLATDLVHRWAAELTARGEHDALLRTLPPGNRSGAGLPTASADAGGGDSWRAVIPAQRHLLRGDRRRAAAEVALARRTARTDAGASVAQLLLATEQLGWLADPPHEEAELHDELEPDDSAVAAIALAARAAARLAGGAVVAARGDAQLALRSARRLGLGLLELQCLWLLGAAAWARGTTALPMRRRWPAPKRPRSEAGRTRSGRWGLLELQRARAQLSGVRVPGQLATLAALLEHRAALSSGHLTAAAATASWLSEQGIGQFELVLMRAWAEAATGAHRTARAVVKPLLDHQPRSVLPSSMIEAALLDAAAALHDGDRTSARGALHTALHGAEQLDAVRPFALAEPEVRALLVDQLGDVEDHHTFAYRAFVSDGRTRLPQAVRLSAREREVLEQLPPCAALTRSPIT